MKPLYYVVWGKGQYREVKTKKKGQHLMRVWRRWMERRGLKVFSWNAVPCIVAEDADGHRSCIAFHTYDRDTKQRLWEPPKKR